MIALGWNYFKLLLEVVERYVVVGVLCYTSPLAYSMGASKDTNHGIQILVPHGRFAVAVACDERMVSSRF